MTGRRVAMHCNAGTTYGMGHLMRCLSLAQHARSRGWDVAFTGDIDPIGVALAERALPGAEVHPASGTAEPPRVIEAADVVHLDTYWDVPFVLPDGPLVSNMQDGEYGVRSADLAIDANLAAERAFQSPELSTHQLVGIDAAVIREQVLRQRAIEPSEPNGRVLVVIGGTDPHGLTPRILEALGGIDSPLTLTVVSRDASDDLLRAARRSPHRVEVVGFVEDLPALARNHDVVVSAAGTSVWDFACMGAPMALICVADNQRLGYRATIDAGMAVGLGEAPYADLDQRVRTIMPLLSDADLRREQRDRLMRSVDGRGTWRIVSAWEQLLEEPSSSAGPAVLSARPAEIEDARMLFDWRNDPATRGASRSQGALEWEHHLAWVRRCLVDSGRLLLIIEQEGRPVGTVRWDRRAGADWEISITIAPEARGTGLARSVLAAGEEALPVSAPVRLIAGIRVDNTASRRLFAGAGYLPYLPADDAGFETRAKWRLFAA